MGGSLDIIVSSSWYIFSCYGMGGGVLRYHCEQFLIHFFLLWDGCVCVGGGPLDIIVSSSRNIFSC